MYHHVKQNNDNTFIITMNCFSLHLDHNYELFLPPFGYVHILINDYSLSHI